LEIKKCVQMVPAEVGCHKDASANFFIILILNVFMRKLRDWFYFNNIAFIWQVLLLNLPIT